MSKSNLADVLSHGCGSKPIRKVPMNKAARGIYDDLKAGLLPEFTMKSWGAISCGSPRCLGGEAEVRMIEAGVAKYPRMGRNPESDIAGYLGISHDVAIELFWPGSSDTHNQFKQNKVWSFGRFRNDGVEVHSPYSATQDEAAEALLRAVAFTEQERLRS